MPGILYPILSILIVFVLAKFLLNIEKRDNNKLHNAFDTVKNDKKALNYLAFVSNQPKWRLSLIGGMIGGLLYYITYTLITQKAWSDKGLLGSAMLVTFIIYFICISLGNYMSSHNICPNNCNDRYQPRDVCTDFSLLPCNKKVSHLE